MMTTLVGVLAATPEIDAAKGKKGGKAPKAKGSSGVPTRASSDPRVPARTLELSWAMLSGRLYKWEPWDAEPTREGAPPCTG